ncbi:3-deoxy-D-manno-octulosonic acid transferase [Leptospira sp. 2 VSF19]|uniref:3-deoxy-D-manno-octulosonic acid transferase n=1 Tax=Leptospira soteropolitanensis TaxID=2950025 RepID=A0AAW5VHH6_9LEPT|nr:glycosyltransferase N-terminal domain-containing protein [Leptospira soteropolitanensis]MCW7492926.1 3-deoxy-D-manno-octulosonic acid transferase [Leptospira soteropolitanensis]MCW7500161.1 3-deoxy-D-manno-octulosonic acid transferase [Leptospira soteropolitanensis]MCW7522412.1 3-deoxy-D-manno-octulosonic acid transferase [Leptospira soteropolitanensis]MCW7526268.1 3-deoxy-D-manno-octulosonic acid transferase [Leptospira soteropolitanensis]MCW7529620.1 3-deoxy-D-manno-octulosonic acid trans
MVYFFYNIFVITIYFVLKFLSLFVKPIREEFKKRDLSLKQIFSKSADGKFVIWLHAASVGELDQARALTETIRKKRKDVYIIQSVFSSSVKETTFSDPLADIYFYLPLDLPYSYDSIFQKFQPQVLFVMAWDTWPNLLKTANRMGTKTYLTCASLSSQSTRKNPLIRSLTKASFRYLTGIYPSHELMAKEFTGLVAENTDFLVLGDTRFESVLGKLETKSPNPVFTNFVSEQKDFLSENKPIILGSTYGICEKHFTTYLKAHTDDSYYWIFPHKWENERMEQLIPQLKEFGTVGVFSKQKKGEPLPKFLLFDLMGILAFAYRYGSFAYVGGAFTHRVHNTIEPAALGLAVITGPKISNAPEAIVMQELGGVIKTENEIDFIQKFQLLVQNKALCEKIGNKNRNFVVENRGASDKIYNRVFSDAKN